MYRINKDRDDTTPEELRGWLAKQLRREDVPRPIWDWLERDGHVEATLDSSQQFDREDLLGIVKERIQFAEEMAPFLDASTSPRPVPRTLGHARIERKPRRAPREQQVYDALLDPLADMAEKLLGAGLPVGPQYGGVIEGLLSRRRAHRDSQIKALNDPLTQRARAFSFYLAKLANTDPKVKDFRQEVLGDGDVPSEEEAEDFLFSPATALLSAAWFNENSVPLMRHTVEVVELQRLSPRWPHQVKGTVKVEWDGGQIVAPFEGAVLSSDPFERGSVGSEPVSALKGSVISELLLLDEHLRERFPWRPLHRDVLQVPMFVLTGKAPWVEPIRVTVPEGYPDLYQTVDITAWPWVPVEEVVSYYERARKELNPTPTTSPKRLTLFIFIMRHPEVEVPREGEKPKVPSWRELLRLWNAQYPEGNEWHYKDVRNLQRDFKEAFEQIVNFYRSDTWVTRTPKNPKLDW